MKLRAALLLVSLGSLSCNAVFGLEPRELAEDDATSALDASGDASSDAALEDVVTVDDGSVDATVDTSITVADSGVLPVDTSQPDTSLADTTVADTTVADTGIIKTDSGTVDTGTSGPLDTGTLDTGAPDTGTPDTGKCDGGPTNACGGCASLLFQPGAACNCDGVYQCTGVDTVTCSRPKCSLFKECCYASGSPVCVCDGCCGIPPQ